MPVGDSGLYIASNLSEVFRDLTKYNQLLSQAKIKTEQLDSGTKRLVQALNQENLAFNANKRVLNQLKAELEATIVERHVAITRRQSDEFQNMSRQGRILTGILRDMTGSMQGLDQSKVIGLSSAFNKLQTAMTKTAVDASTVLRVFLSLRNGEIPSAADLGLDPETFQRILPLVGQVVSIEKQHTQQIARQNALLKQQEAIKRAKVAESKAQNSSRLQAGTFVRNQFLPSANLAGGSQIEVANFNAANTALIKIATKHKLTYKQLEALLADYKNKTARVYNDIENKVLSTLRRIDVAHRNLGRTARQQAEHAARAQARSMQTASTSYDAADSSLKNILISWRSLVRLASIQVLHIAFGRFISSIREAIKEIGELQIKISQIRTISQRAQLSFDTWTDSILRLSSQFGRTGADVAEGAYLTLTNQVAEGTRTIGFLSEALRFSRVAVTTTADAVNLGTAALNSFGRTAEEAEETFAQMFKTIELGRVMGSELANTYGRVAPLANQLGIELAELNAMIATITLSGVKNSEAMSQIAGIMQKLIKPTDVFKDILAEWGVTSGEAAIRTFGFVGVLRKLEEEASRGGDRLQGLADIFNRIRAIRGAGFLTDPKILQQYEQSVLKINGALKDYKDSTKIAFESAGAIVEIQTQAFKNHIIRNYAQPILEATANVVRAGDSFVKIFERIRASILPVGAAFVTLRLAMKLLSVTVKGEIGKDAVVSFANLGVNIDADTKKINKLALQTKLLGVAISSAITVGLTVLTVFITKMVVANAQAKAMREQGIRSLSEGMAELRLVTSQAREEAEEFTVTLNFRLKRALDLQFRSYLAFVSKVRTAFNELAQSQLANIGIIDKLLKKSTTNIIENIEDIIRGTRRNIENLKRDIEQIGTLLATTQKEAGRARFERGFKLLELNDNPDQLIAALTSRITELRTKIAEAFNSGDVAGLEEIYAEIDKLLERRFDLLVKIKEEGLDSDINARIQQHERTVNALIEERIRLFEHLKKLKDEELQRDEARAKQQEQILQNFRDKLVEVENIKILKSDDLETLNTKADEFTSLANQLLQVAQQAGISPDAFIQLQARLNDKLAKFEELIHTAETQQLLAEQVTQLNNIRQAIENQTAETLRSQQDAEKLFDTLVAKLGENIPNVADILKNLAEFGRDGNLLFTAQDRTTLEALIRAGFFGTHGNLPGRSNATPDDARLAFRQSGFATTKIDVASLAQALTQALAKFERNRTPDNLNNVRQLLESAKTLAIVLQGVRPDDLKDKDTGDRVSALLIELLATMDKTLEKATEANRLRAELDAKIAGFEADAQQKQDQINRLTQQLGLDSLEFMQRNELIDALNRAAISVENLVERLQNQYPDITRTSQNIRTGEGRNIQTVSFGDINISVEGGDSSEQTIQQIAEGLRRELRRGTIPAFA